MPRLTLEQKIIQAVAAGDFELAKTLQQELAAKRKSKAKPKVKSSPPEEEGVFKMTPKITQKELGHKSAVSGKIFKGNSFKDKLPPGVKKGESYNEVKKRPPYKKQKFTCAKCNHTYSLPPGEVNAAMDPTCTFICDNCLGNMRTPD